MRAALIGTDLQENLSLQYLAAACTFAGHEARLVSFNYRGDIPAATRAVRELAPDLVGLSMAFQFSIDDYFALAANLRKEGFHGHITCGGHVPTFCYEEILRDAPAIDTAVRHEGEETLVALLDALGKGERPAEIPGLVSREGDGIFVAPPRPFVKDLDTLRRPVRRRRPYMTAGVPVAFVITSRGCVGRCAYCSIRSFSSSAGGGRYRLRAVEPVADEIAALRAELGIRAFLIQDDLFILPGEKKSLARMHALNDALHRRGADDLLMWIKARPETITPAIIEAARAMHVIQIFLGIENASHDRLRYLGRTHGPMDNERALALCEAAGIRISFNLMIFDPDATLEDVRHNLDFASAHPTLPWNMGRTEIYSGTELFHRLRGEGRLEGDYRALGYTIKDERAEMLFRMMRACFQSRCFECGSLHNRLTSMDFTCHLHTTLFPGPTSQRITDDLRALEKEVHLDTIARLERMMGFILKGGHRDKRALRRFTIGEALEINEADSAWRTRHDRIADRLNAQAVTS